MKPLLFCAAQLSVIDINTNSFSVINVYEEINASTFPAVIPSISLALLITRDDTEQNVNEGALRVRFNDRVVFDNSVKLDFQGRFRLRAVNVIQGLILPSPGVLTFSFASDDIELGSWSVVVNQIGAPQSDLFTTVSDRPAPPT